MNHLALAGCILYVNKNKYIQILFQTSNLPSHFARSCAEMVQSYAHDLTGKRKDGRRIMGTFVKFKYSFFHGKRPIEIPPKYITLTCCCQLFLLNTLDACQCGP